MFIRSLCLLAVLLAAVNAAVVNVIVGPPGSLTFNPQNITIQAGDIVSWTWQSGDHTVDSGLLFSKCVTDNLFSSDGTHDAGFVFNVTFDSVGSFPYLCAKHCGAGMYGNINVVASPVTLTSGSSTGGSTINSTSTTSKISIHTASTSGSTTDTLTSSTTTTDGNQTSASTDATSPSSTLSPSSTFFLLVVVGLLGLTYVF